MGIGKYVCKNSDSIGKNSENWPIVPHKMKKLLQNKRNHNLDEETTQVKDTPMVYSLNYQLDWF